MNRYDTIKEIRKFYAYVGHQCGNFTPEQLMDHLAHKNEEELDDYLYDLMELYGEMNDGHREEL